MLLEFFQLREQPFGVTPDPAYLYPSQTHCEALDSLTEAILGDRGFLALIAERNGEPARGINRAPARCRSASRRLSPSL